MSREHCTVRSPDKPGRCGWKIVYLKGTYVCIGGVVARDLSGLSRRLFAVVEVEFYFAAPPEQVERSSRRKRKTRMRTMRKARSVGRLP